MLGRVTDHKEIEDVGKANLISDTNKKAVTAADPNGKHFKQEMKTDLIIQAIKNCAEVAANLNWEPLIKEEKKYNLNGKALKINNIQMEEEKTNEENEDEVEVADPIGDAEKEKLLL